MPRLGFSLELSSTALAWILVVASVVGCGGRSQHPGIDASDDLRGAAEAIHDAGDDQQPAGGDAVDAEAERPQQERPMLYDYSGDFFSVFPRPYGTHTSTSILFTGDVTAPGCSGQASSEELAVFVERATRQDVIAAFADMAPCPTPSGNHVDVTIEYSSGRVMRDAGCAAAISELVQAADTLVAAVCARADAGAP